MSNEEENNPEPTCRDREIAEALDALIEKAFAYVKESPEGSDDEKAAIEALGILLYARRGISNVFDCFTGLKLEEKYSIWFGRIEKEIPAEEQTPKGNTN